VRGAALCDRLQVRAQLRVALREATPLGKSRRVGGHQEEPCCLERQTRRNAWGCRREASSVETIEFARLLLMTFAAECVDNESPSSGSTDAGEVIGTDFVPRLDTCEEPPRSATSTSASSSMAPPSSHLHSSSSIQPSSS
jgi:hypothetical protein